MGIKSIVFFEEYDSKFKEWYETVEEKFRKDGWGRFLDQSDVNESEIVTTCDVYYGGVSHIALEFEVKKKRVMIMGMEEREYEGLRNVLNDRYII